MTLLGKPMNNFNDLELVSDVKTLAFFEIGG